MSKINLCQLTSNSFWLLEKLNEPIDPQTINKPLLHAALFHATNMERRKMGLPILVYSDILKVSALIHSAEMKVNNFFAHENPVKSSLYSPLDRVRTAGGGRIYQIVGENIADFPILKDDLTTPVILKPFINIYQNAILGNETYKNMAMKITKGWMSSVGHRRNILNKLYQQVGFGVVLHKRRMNGVDFDYILCTQNFGRTFKS